MCTDRDDRDHVMSRCAVCLRAYKREHMRRKRGSRRGLFVAIDYHEAYVAAARVPMPARVTEMEAA